MLQYMLCSDHFTQNCSVYWRKGANTVYFSLKPMCWYHQALLSFRNISLSVLGDLWRASLFQFMPFASRPFRPECVAPDFVFTKPPLSSSPSDEPTRRWDLRAEQSQLIVLAYSRFSSPFIILVSPLPNRRKTPCGTQPRMLLGLALITSLQNVSDSGASEGHLQ